MEEPVVVTAPVVEGAEVETAPVVETEEVFNPFDITDVPEKKEKKEEVDGDMDDDERKVISKVVASETSDVRKSMSSLQSEMRVAEFLSQNEEYKQYAGKIREVAKHPAAKGLTIDGVVALALGPKELMKIGADRFVKAQEEANNSRTGGTSRGASPTGGMKNAFDLSPQEFAKVREKYGI